VQGEHSPNVPESFVSNGFGDIGAENYFQESLQFRDHAALKSPMFQKLISKIRLVQAPIITAIGVSSIVIGLGYTGWWQLLEWACFDWFLRHRPLESIDERIVVVGIDDSDIQTFGWPISDQSLAQLLEKIKAQGPRAIGLDIYRDLPIEPGHDALNQIFATTPNLYGIEKALGRTITAPGVLVEKGQVAFSDFDRDDDGKTRRGLLTIDNQAGQKYSLSLQLALTYLEPEGIAPKQVGASKQFRLGQSLFSPLRPNSGSYAGLDARGYQVLLNLRRAESPSCDRSSPTCAFPTVSMADVLAGQIAPDLLEDRIVLIGYTALSLYDRLDSSYTINDHTTHTGVEIHAQLASQIISAALEARPLLQPLPEAVEWLWIILCASGSSALGYSFLRGQRRIILSLIVAELGILGVSYGVLLLNSWWLPTFAPLVAATGAALISISYVLSRSLQQSYQKLEEYAQTLEQKVEARTEQLRSRTEELRRSEEKFSKAFQASPAPITITSLTTGKHLEANQSFLNVTGYSAQEVQGRTAKELDLWVNLEERDRFMVELQTAGRVQNFEFQYRTRLGEIRTALLSAEVIDLYGAENCLLAISSDITERKRIENKLKKAQREAISANRTKSDFLAGMSHELRTPLNAIMGFTNLMARVPLPHPDHQQYLQIIGHSSEHLMSLINDVLDLSKIEAGKVTLDINSFDLYSLLNTVKSMFKLRAESKHLDLMVKIDRSLPRYVQADERKLSQILINLLGNSIKFTDQGVVSLRAKAEKIARLPPESGDSASIAGATPPSHRLIFEVSDTGPGIAPEEIDKLFEAFTQTTTGRQSQEGTGLGLPISQKFVELMGGELRVASLVGEGSTFTFDIEAHLAQLKDFHQQKHRRVMGLQPGQPKYRLLVADDRLENRILFCKLLTSVGFEVQEAENGQEAVKRWQQWQPDLIWLDIHMPVMDGYQAAQEIRRQERMLGKQQSVSEPVTPEPVTPEPITPEPVMTGLSKPDLDLGATIQQILATEKFPAHPPVPLIAITASALVEDQPRMFAAGFNDVVYKPFQEHLIYEKIAKYLQVKYIYETPEVEGGHSLPLHLTNSSQDEGLKGEDLADFKAMPQPWLAQLGQAAIEGDDEQILELIEAIPKTKVSLIQTLKTWTNNFQFESIVALIPGQES
jgi:PAS domain S-box-containing protein